MQEKLICFPSEKDKSLRRVHEKLLRQGFVIGEGMPGNSLRVFAFLRLVRLKTRSPPAMRRGEHSEATMLRSGEHWDEPRCVR